MDVKGLIFDLDGTLLDSMWVWEKVDVDFLGSRGFEVPIGYQRAIAAMGFEETANYTIELFGLEERPEDIMQEWTEMARRTYHEEVGLKPYVKEFLERQRQRGIRMGVATSSYQALFRKCLERTGIYGYFDSITETREVERGKNFPDVYIKAAEKLRCRPEECVVFEDIHPGILAAKAGKFRTVAVYDEKWSHAWEQIKQDADRAIMGFGELLDET